MHDLRYNGSRKRHGVEEGGQLQRVVTYDRELTLPVAQKAKMALSAESSELLFSERATQWHMVTEVTSKETLASPKKPKENALHVLHLHP